jgi:hypothetical protein
MHMAATQIGGLVLDGTKATHTRRRMKPGNASVRNGYLRQKALTEWAPLSPNYYLGEMEKYLEMPFPNIRPDSHNYFKRFRRKPLN